jgi:glycosyltransferase involved in cell wall biosynthesis
MSKKRVLVFTEKALALSETFIADHCRSLSDYEPVLVALDEVKGGLAFDDVPVRYIMKDRSDDALRRLAYRLGHSPRMDAVFRDVRPDIVHAHYLTNGAFILPYALRHDVPLVVTAHGYDATRRPKATSLYDRIFSARKRALARRAAIVLPVSDYLRDKLYEQGFPTDKVETHYLGIRLGPDRPTDVAANPQRLVFAGRLVEKKGIDVVLQAFETVRAALPSAELHLVGDGPLRPMVDAAARRVGGIVAHGAAPHARVLEIMRSGRVFTMPSREASDGDAEGLGLTLVEAQAMGLPAVTSSETGTRETVDPGVTGLLVAPRDVDGMAEAYISLLSDPARSATMGAAARAWVERRFDIAIQTRQLECIYDRFVAR